MVTSGKKRWRFNLMANYLECTWRIIRRRGGGWIGSARWMYSIAENKEAYIGDLGCWEVKEWSWNWFLFFDVWFVYLVRSWKLSLLMRWLLLKKSRKLFWMTLKPKVPTYWFGFIFVSNICFSLCAVFNFYHYQYLKSWYNLYSASYDIDLGLSIYFFLAMILIM